METFRGESADEVWAQAAAALVASGETQPSRSEPTKELRHVVMEVRKPRDRVVFARPMNPALAVAEVIWILAGGNDSKFLIFWNPVMRDFTDDGQDAFYGAYGFRLGSRPRLSPHAEASLRLVSPVPPAQFDQLRKAELALRQTNHSRQVVLQVWDTGLDFPSSVPRSNDIPCNVMSHLLLRNGRLEWLQVMRSNDIVWGLPNNFVQWTSLQEIVAGWLDVETGPYVHISDSLHAYKRHWGALEGWTQDYVAHVHGLPGNLRIAGYEEWQPIFSQVVDLALELTISPDAAKIMAIREQAHALPSGYEQWIALLAADALRRTGHVEEALQLVPEAGQYWADSWQKWEASKAPKDGLENP